jgi:hypothetical protein
MLELAESQRVMYPQLLKDLQKLGIDVDEFNDHLVGYSHRRPNAEPGDAMYMYLKKKLIQTKNAPFMHARDAVLRHLPTTVVNQMTRLAAVTGVRWNKKAAEAEWAAMTPEQIGAPEWYRAPQPGTYSEDVFNLARENDASYPTMNGLAQQIKAEHSVGKKAKNLDRKEKFAVADSILSGWRSLVGKVVKNDAVDYTSIVGFDEVVQAFNDRWGGDWTSESVFDYLKDWNKKAVPDLDNKTLAQKALERYQKLRDGVDEDAALFDPDLFDVSRDPTAFPDPAFNGKPLKYSFENAGYLLAKQFGLPTWWRKDELYRNALKESADPVLSGLAKSDAGDHDFKTALWDHFKEAEKSLPPEAQWASVASDVDDFMDAAAGVDEVMVGGVKTKVARVPDMNAVPILSQDDLITLARKLHGMPKQVLEEGLFNRGTITDGVDYLLHATRLKAGVASARRMLKQDGVLRDVTEKGATGKTLQDTWTDMGLTPEGLADFITETTGKAMSHEEVMKFAASKVVDPEVGGTLKRYVELFKGTEEVGNDVMKVADMLNGLWKGTLTIPYIAFHTRNRISGIFANWAAGIHNAEGDEIAHKMFYNKLTDSDELIDGIIDEIKALDITSVGKGGADSQVYDRLEKFRGVGMADTPVGKSKYGAVGDNFDYIVRGPFGDLIADTKQAYAAGGAKGAAKQFFGFGGVKPDGSLPTDMNIFGIKNGMDPIGRKRRVDLMAEKGEKGLTGADSFVADSTTNAWYKAGTNANDYVEWMNRVGPYIALRKAGWSPAMAARKVKQVQFDYKQLSPLEKKYARRLIPFYSFMRKNLEQQTRLLMENPGGRTAQVIRAENNLRREGKSNGGHVPRYLAESFAVRLPGDSVDGTAQFFSQSGLLPADEAFNRFQFDDSGLPLNLTRTGEKFLAQSHPVIQGVGERIAGKQFWSGRNLDDLYQEPTSDQDINFWVSKTPLSRAQSTVGGLFDDRKSVAQKLFNLTIGGAKITDVNMEKQRALETRDILERELGADPDIGKYTGLYANDMAGLIERYKAGDVEAAKKLKLYMAMKEELKQIKKTEKSKKLPAPPG